MYFATWWMTGLWLAMGALLGAGLHALWLRNRRALEPLAQGKWPLAARSLLTAQESKVLQWLTDTFHDHIVMVKVSVLRYMAPTPKGKNDEAQRWQDILNGVHCTYTVCTPQGQVVGCVDLPGKHGLSPAQRAFKEKLLSDCGIAYTAVLLTDLPKRTSMRAAFLGEALQEQQPQQTTLGGDSNFQADLASFNRHAKQVAKEAALAQLNKKSGKGA